MRLILLLVFLFTTISISLPAFAVDAIHVKSNHFTLSGEIKSDEAIEMISELERFRSSLLELHGITPNADDRVVGIYVISDPEMFEILGLEEGFVALYYPSSVGPKALINGNALTDDPGQLRLSLRHEYVHHFSITHLDMPLPRWLGEGIAEYYSGYEELDDGRYQIGVTHPTRVELLTYPLAGWYPFKDQILNFTTIVKTAVPAHSRPKEWLELPDRSTFFYAQSWALVHYMKNQPGGVEKLERLTERMIGLQGGSIPLTKFTSDAHYKVWKEKGFDEFDQAIEEILGHKPADMLTILQTYAASDPSFTTHSPNPNRTNPTISIDTLSPTQAAAYQYRLMSLISHHATIKNKMKEVRALVETDPDLKASLLISDAAQQSKLGFPVTALEKIDKALALDPNAEDGQRLRIQLEYEQFANGNFYQDEKMRGLLRTLLATAPNDPELLVQMVTTGVKSPDIMSPDVATALAKIDRLQIVKKDPYRALPLVNYYIAKEDYVQALYLAQRGKPFAGPNFELERLIDQLKEAVSESSTP